MRSPIAPRRWWNFCDARAAITRNSSVCQDLGPLLTLRIKSGNGTDDGRAGASIGRERIATLHAQRCHWADTLVTYSILTTLVAGLLMTGLYRDADDRLRTGDIAVDLLKPLRYPLYLFSDGLGRSAYQLLFTVVPTLAVAWPLFGFSPPASPGYALAFLAALGLALSVSFAIGYLIALLAFWFLTTMHFRFAVAGFITAFSGSFLPLWFFPPGWAAVARALPFQYLGFVPAAAYMGEMAAAELTLTLAGGVAWTLALLGLAYALWSASVRRLVVQGG